MLQFLLFKHLKLDFILFQILNLITFGNLPSFYKIKFSKTWQMFWKEIPLQVPLPPIKTELPPGIQGLAFILLRRILKFCKISTLKPANVFC